jgi:hypothetical protein
LGCNTYYQQDGDIKKESNKFHGFHDTKCRKLGQKTVRSMKLKFCEVVAVPVVTYGCQNWVVKRLDRHKVAAPKTFLRPTARHIHDQILNMGYLNVTN